MKAVAMGLVAALGILSAAPAYAAEADRRVVRQQARIVQGVKSGELTAREAARLEVREQSIKRDIRRSRADDGKLDVRERARLDRRQDRVSRDIYGQKHDGQKR